MMISSMGKALRVRLERPRHEFRRPFFAHHAILRGWKRVVGGLFVITAISSASKIVDAKVPIVAVFDVQVQRVKLRAGALRALSSYIGSRLTASGQYSVVPRSTLQGRLRQEKRGSYKNCYDQGCQIQIGRELAANKSLATEVLRIGRLCIVTATLYDLKKSATEYAGTTKGGCSEDALVASIDKVIGLLTTQAKTASASAPSVGASRVQASPPPAWAYSSKRGPGAKGATHRCAMGNAADCTEQCRRAHGESCNRLGYMYEKGQGVAKSLLGASVFYRRACILRIAKGCSNLGVMYEKGWGVSENPGLAIYYYRKACKKGNLVGCVNLGNVYFFGKGVAKNIKWAISYYRGACGKGESSGCFRLGIMYELGSGVPKNAVRATVYYRKACDAGRGRGCTRIGRMVEMGHGIPASSGVAATFYRRGCKKGDARGCGLLGGLYLRGKGVPKDATRGRQLLRKACTQGNKLSCVQGCRYGDKFSCKRVGR